MNVKIRNNYGMELKAIGRIEEARKQYLVSIIIIIIILCVQHHGVYYFCQHSMIILPPPPPFFYRKALRLIQTTTRCTLTLETWSQTRGTTRKQLPCMPGLSPNPHSENK